ncbi:MAG: GNAT family N-acetyltransferase [Ilumatobacteraceae bacterium]
MDRVEALDDRNRWSTSVVLSDGDTAFIRPITTDDKASLLAFHESQPRENLYKRFFSPKPTLNEKELDHFTNIDFHDRVALAVEQRGTWIGWASYERWQHRDDAEVAFMVDDDRQGLGIATILLEHLASIARSNGIKRFTAEALSDNRSMLSVFNRAGWPVQKHFDSGLTEVEFTLTETEQFVDSVEGREHRADSRAIARLLLPKSIAVIGASDKPGSIGNEVWKNASTFDGPVYPVNTSHATIGGNPAFASVVDIADDVWLAIIAVPAAALESTIESCIAKRVRGAVLITATDGTDVDMEGLVAHARRNGLRIIGPASMGVATSRPGGVQGALVPVTLPVGGVAISMQSGSLGSSLLQLALHLHLGISWFVSLGDKGDVSGNDLLQFWEDDDSTSVIAMYTESFGNPRKFARIARRVGRHKPIVAVRTGTAAVGNAANALYRQAGLVEVPTVRALLDTARVFATQPVPTGPNVAILTNARSPGVLAAAAVTAAGLRVVDAPLPLDWRSMPADFEHAILAAITDPAIDMVMVIHAPPIITAHAPSTEIDRAASDATKPVVAVMLGRDDGPLRPDSKVPSFSFPEPAAAALGRMYAYGHWLRTEAESAIELLDADTALADALLAESAIAGETTMDYDRTIRLLAAYGVVAPSGAHLVGGSDDELVEHARTVGYPVVVKATKRRVGRSAKAGIALDLGNDAAVRAAVVTIRASLGDAADSFVVQTMATPGLDVRIQCATDDRLGPVVTLDLGSLQSINLDDGASRLPPISRATAEAMIAGSRVGGALEAAQIGAEPLVETIVRVSQLMFQHTEIRSIDINPAIVSDGRCVITDAKIVIDTERPSDFPLRRLG